MIFTGPSPRVFTIPASTSFVDALADGLLAEAAGDAAALADMEILVPTRRSVGSLRQAFLRRSDGAALLLPKIEPVGDAMEEDLAFTGSGQDLSLPPPIADTQRRLVLARMILSGPGGAEMMPGDAVRLAGALAQLVDEMAEHDVDPSKLEALVPDDLAVHWQRTLDFLQVVLDVWPGYLASREAMDPGAHQALIMEKRIAAIAAYSPDHPFFIAGSTGSVPATAKLMTLAASLAMGAVILPGLDREIDAESWHSAQREPSHPQHVMTGLLGRMKLTPTDVQLWPGTAAPTKIERARSDLIREVMRPAATSEKWRSLPSPDPDGLQGITWIECPGIEEEAAAIALSLREAAEDKSKTAALVTPDRDLARRVAAHLERWQLQIDDSGGKALGHTPPGVFLRLLCDAAVDGFGPVSLLALLKHPLAAGGWPIASFRDAARLLDRDVLRGPRPKAGLDGLIARIKAVGEAKPVLPSHKSLDAFATRLDWLLRPLSDALAEKHSPAGTLLDIHLQTLEALAATEEEAGGTRLWVGEAGEALADLVAELAPALDSLGPIPCASFPDLIDVFLAQRPVRPRYGSHPRLFLWGPLEARLQRVDRMILGGLNENTWPPEPATDPWMSRPMRAALGLPSPERRLGQSAHDFAQAFAAKEVILTRALKVGGTPTVPSRWLTRLNAVLGRVGEGLKRQEAFQIAELLDEPGHSVALSRPEPKPPLAARPKRYSVSDIETLIADPYQIFAKHVLALRPLEPLDQEPGAAERGTAIHGALKAFADAVPGPLPANALDLLLEAGETAMAAYADRPTVVAMWRPRFARLAAFVIDAEKDRRPDIQHLSTEITGAVALPIAGDTVELHGRADRIEHRTDGSRVIVDYKTGSVPRSSEIVSGAKPQLPLEALIAHNAGFPNSKGDVAGLEHWSLKGTEPAGEVIQVKADDLNAVIQATAAGLVALLSHYVGDESSGYPAYPPESKRADYNPYAHLARATEWGRDGEGDE